MKKSFLNQMAAARRWQTSAVRAFSLTELLVVLALIAVLASVFLSASFTTKERVLRAECVSNLRQIGTGWSMYQNDFNQMMPCHWPGYASSGGTSNPWRTCMVGQVVSPTPGWQVDPREPNGLDGPWNLGMLFASGLIPNPRVFYCPGTAQIDIRHSYDYDAATSNTWPSTLMDDLIQTGYNYFPQGRKLETVGNGHLVPIAGNGVFPPSMSPLQQNDINPNKSIVTDLSRDIEHWSHLASGSVAGLNALFPDGRVVFQNARSNPQAFDPALWLHSTDPNFNYIGNNPANFRYVMSLWHP